ncbi:TPA: response regulator transcription factor [Vibrio cholerae]|nr:response regulator transcription factor [Vibrio cholerae]
MMLLSLKFIEVILLPSFFGFALVSFLILFVSLLVISFYRVKVKAQQLEIQLSEISQKHTDVLRQLSFEKDTTQQLLDELNRSFAWLKVSISSFDERHKEICPLMERISQLIETSRLVNTTENLTFSTPFLMQPWLKGRLSHEKAKTRFELRIHVREIPDVLVQMNFELLEKVFSRFFHDIQNNNFTFYAIEMEHEKGVRFTLTGDLALEDWEECADTQYLMLKKEVTANGGELCCQHSAKVITHYTVFLPAIIHQLPKFMPDLTHFYQDIADETKAKILIVESDPEVMDWLYFHLAPDYRIALCQTLHGAQYELDEYGCDLILCNAILNDGDAAEWLAQLKNMSEYAAIPFVILTEFDSQQQRLQAWQSCADDCISKSSDPALLVLRLNALLENRRLIQQQMLSISLQSKPIEQVEEVTESAESPDAQFAKQLRQVIDRYVTSQELTVDFVAQQFHTSSRSLQRRLQTVFGLSFSQYLKQTQLQRAKEALIEGRTVKEAAFHAGFTSQNYFGRVFRAEYGVPPSQFKKEFAKKQTSK